MTEKREEGEMNQNALCTRIELSAFYTRMELSKNKVTLPNKRFLIYDILLILIIPHRGSYKIKNPILGVLRTRWDNRNKGNFQESAFLSVISKAT